MILHRSNRGIIADKGEQSPQRALRRARPRAVDVGHVDEVVVEEADPQRGQHDQHAQEQDPAVGAGVSEQAAQHPGSISEHPCGRGRKG